MRKNVRLIMLCCLIVLNLSAQATRFQSGNNKNAIKEQIQVNAKVKTLSHIMPAKMVDANAMQKFDVKKTNFTKVSKAKNVELKALFTRPIGTYIPSLSGNSEPIHLGYSYIYPGHFGSAYSTPWVFRNLSTGATSYSWDWSTKIGFSTETNVTIKDDENNFLSAGAYYTPVLTAKSETEESSYAMADSGENVSTLFSGSDAMYVGNADYYANTANADKYGHSIWYVGASGGTSLNGKGKGYFWGTCLRATDGTNGSKVNAIYNFYEKPMSPLVVKDICYFGVNAEKNNIPVPIGKSLSVAIIKLNSEGQITADTIAKSTLYGEDVIVDEYFNVFLPFTFNEIDPETGRETPTELVINDGFVVVISGLEQDGMDFGLLSDYDNLIEGTSYFTKVDASTGVLDDGLYSSSSNKMNVYLTLNSYFNYLYANPSTASLKAPIAGGSAVDSNDEAGAIIYSHFNVVDSVTQETKVWIDQTTLPDWITIAYNDSYFKDYNALIFDFITTALPENITGRTAHVKFLSKGAEATITISQGNISGFKNTTDNNLVAASTENGFKLSYPVDYKTVSLYNITGQLIGEYQLSASGSSDISANVKNGSYILKFVGAKTSTLKVIK